LPENSPLPLVPPSVSEGGVTSWGQAIKRRIGLDRSIAFIVLGRVLQGLGSIGTVTLIVRSLTPAEQGYYYSLWSLVALQIVFELGFSFVILQIAAHERVHLNIAPDGSVNGPDGPLRRLAAVLQLSVRWYLTAAVVMGIALLVGGSHFFSLRQPAHSAAVWIWPLRATVLSCCVTFAIGPVLSFLEGCGLVPQVSKVRFLQSFVATGLAWIAMLTHHGLFAPAAVLAGQGIVAFGLIYAERNLLFPLIRLPGTKGAINWRREVFPFQWKIAISWLCDYFIFQLFTPVLFAFRGPVEAGRMGISMSAVMQLSGIILAWMSTKATPFGMLVARQETAELDRLFFRTLRQSLALLGGGAALMLAFVIALPHFSLRLGSRIEPWPVFLLLLLTSLSAHIVQSEALYLRAHKVEPFLVQSIVIALATVGSILLVVRRWGTFGVSMAYFLILGVAGLISATLIFSAMRRKWNSGSRSQSKTSPCP
jgi:O-antigen/teichoic acid export membrane protein